MGYINGVEYFIYLIGLAICTIWAVAAVIVGLFSKK